ncbi:uncharacterized mitochondrial protein AtMg00810-like [Penaeus japonicus]|uniref:uncharacterized mitochondrial protein AtMg00810-like n=1 Tax=Penaeus japonicus TaxID=27405 RepID=UPI001C70B71F|nr:uncharacterized mitochondrial protein AtMg00810-like [Penaeus japonicus]
MKTFVPRMSVQQPEQPEGYKEKDSDGNVLYCKLNKSLYGPKQSGRMMTDLGKLKWFLGMSFATGKDYNKVNQKYLENFLDRFRMLDCHARNTPCDPSIVITYTVESDVLANANLYREIVGSLIYIMTGTRPDICYAVTKLSQYMSKPTKAHLNAAIHVRKYLKGTLDYGLRFDKSDEQMNLMGFCDSD